jgi:hypothetical protein
VIPNSAYTCRSPRSLSAKILAVTLVAFCFLLFLPMPSFGQASAGITGTVIDSSGAVIGDAQVTITDVATSIAIKAVTSSSGVYTVRGLNPARYSIAVVAHGFKKEIQEATVEVSTVATIDFTMALGIASDTVEVTADQIALNTTQPELGSTIEPEVVAALPSEVSGRGRQIDTLQFLAPGTTGSTFSHRVSGGVDFEEEIIYNGIPVPQSETEGYTTNYDPPFDMVEEFKVQRTTFSAQYGLGQGALTYQTKSGTNKYHGDLFEINRNSFFDSVGFFNGPNFNGNNPRDHAPVDHENNYGFSIQGPIRIPHLYDGRDKTFGHYSQEWYKQNSENLSTGTVPTAAEKAGDFSNYLGTNAAGQTVVIPIYDPLTGLPFPGNVIPQGRFSATASSLLQYIPDPDAPGTGIGNQDNNKSPVHFISPNIQHVWGFSVDQTLTPKQSLHYSQWRNTFHSESFDNAPIVLFPNPLESLRSYPNVGSVFLLNYDYTITPKLAMTAGFGWVGEINNQFNINKFAPLGTFVGVQQEDIFPSITFDGDHSTTAFGTGGSNSGSVNRKLGLAFVNNYLWSKGRHTFNIGWELRRSFQDDNEEQTEGGHFAFSHHQTDIPNTTDANYGNYGSSFASFLLGLPDSENRSNSLEEKLRNWDISPYVQDDIKLSPKLTLNVGLRWDIEVPFTETDNLIVYFNQDNPGTDPAAIGPNGPIPGSATKFGSCTGCAGYTHADTHYQHLGPRAGFAYKVSNKMVVQGGFAVAILNGGAYEYGTSKVAVNYGNLLTGQFNRASSSTTTSAPGSWDTNLIPASNPTPFSPGLGGGNQIDSFSKHDGYAPYSQQWNINVQRELPYNMLFTGAWVGNRVIHLPSQNNRIDQMNPAFDAQYGNVQSSCGPPGTSVLADNFAPYDPVTNKTGCAVADGFTLPYSTFVKDFGNSSTVAQSLVPYPQYNYIFNNFEAKGTDYYQSLQLEVDKRFSNGLAFLAGYTLSHLLSNADSGFSSFANGGINKYNQKPEYVVSNADEPQTFKFSGTYELPIGPKKKFFNNHGVTGQIIGGWQIGWITDYEDGGPFGVGENGYSPFPNGFDRPDRNSSVPLHTASYNKLKDYYLNGATGNGAQFFDPTAFTKTPTQYVIGDALRNYGALRGVKYLNENLNARKHFYIGERFQAVLQVDYFNAFNRTQFTAGVNTDATSGNFGQFNTGNGNGQINRQGQVKLDVTF